jgi:hypothetical protein
MEGGEERNEDFDWICWPGLDLMAETLVVLTLIPAKYIERKWRKGTGGERNKHREDRR